MVGIFAQPLSCGAQHEGARGAVPERLLQSGARYRATGVRLFGLEVVQHAQLDLFGESLKIDRYERLFQCVDAIKKRYGKHTLFLGSSFLAHQHAQHEGARGAEPERKRVLFKGETKRKRLAIPMFLGKVE
jgi:hypothetical protein